MGSTLSQLLPPACRASIFHDHLTKQSWLCWLRNGVIMNHRGIENSFKALQKLTTACNAVTWELSQ